MTSALPFSPASERNREPILAALRPWLAPAGSALEIASGTGQHVAHFAHALPDWHWQPSDLTADLFAAIVTRTAHLPRVAAPVRLDVRDAPWPSAGPAWDKPFDLIFAANMLHIAPWACTPALMRGAARHLAPGGRLVTYGPYFEADVPTAPSNLAFDADLRARHPDWGIRERAAVEREAHAAGLRLAHRAALPANNLLLVFERG
ncbi:DUF938 domain-containing protein [Ottowia sp. GY511]|uniref:DUF938 domain-containing protein n=1 Tax=Ottowia flava TaxID=2675430 RepID=A0ABW4KVD3_9BURK|nr:DUF938 domain-containing protein [Ottowia sp. GY511]TXK26630.1 DUF938 domain-containing protein [Ottowia sp. GY511]